MLKDEYDFINNIRRDAHDAGYYQGFADCRREQADIQNRLRKEIEYLQKRIAYYERRYASMQDNYDKRVKNLEEKNARLNDQITKLKEGLS